jgi:hypothetical protein
MQLMKTRYVTIILRVRLDESPHQGAPGGEISGSVQQAGRQEVRFFNSRQTLQAALQQVVNGEQEKSDQE